MSPVTRSLVAAIVIALAALGATAAVTLYGSERLTEVRRDAVAVQQERLDRIAQRVEDLVSVLVQLTRAQATAVAPLRTRAEVMHGVQRLHLAADRSVYGSGVVYAPYAFSPSVESFGIYAMRTTSGGTTLQTIFAPHTDIVEAPWYLSAREAAGKIVVLAPYVATKSGPYITAVQAFYDKGRFAGVSIADEKVSALRQSLGELLQRGDVVTIVRGDGVPLAIAGTGVEGEGENTLSANVRLVRWRVAMTSSMAQYEGLRRLIIGAIASLLLGIWLLAAIAMGRLLRKGIRRDRAAALVERNAALERIAYTDPLTGLPNRAATIAYVDRTIAQHRERMDRSFALMFVDLDRFAIVNDSLGHAVGDSVLVMVAQRICEHLPPDAFFGRLGGDEFVVCLEGDVGRYAELALAIVNNVHKPVTVDGHDIVLSGSIGVVEASLGYASADAMLRDADIAMYAAKNSGRAQFAVFNEAMHRKALHRLALEEKLRRAIKNRDFRAHYQPIVEIATGKTVSVESLARWAGPDGEGVSTEEFIVAAEQTGLIATIDAMMFANACADARTLREIAPEITFDVNVSATMLARGELVEQFVSMLEHFGLSASQFKLELTETAFMEHPQNGLRLLQRARALGAEVLIDDFGMGYSSLSYVQQLPISGLKIDRSFVEPLTRERRSVEIVRAIVALARALDVHVTAEGVESSEQLDILRDLGVQYAQGFYFSKALAFEELVAYLASSRAQAVAI